MPTSIISAQAWQKSAKLPHKISRWAKNSLRYLFCYLENLLDFFLLNVLRFVLAYRNFLEILLKEFLEEKSH